MLQLLHGNRHELVTLTLGGNDLPRRIPFHFQRKLELCDCPLTLSDLGLSPSCLLLQRHNGPRALMLGIVLTLLGR